MRRVERSGRSGVTGGVDSSLQSQPLRAECDSGVSDCHNMTSALPGGSNCHRCHKPSPADVIRHEQEGAEWAMQVCSQNLEAVF